MAAAIEAVDLRKRYPPEVQALDGVSLTVEAGTIFGVLGPNGAGKSTLTRVLCTLTRPDGGAATVAGIDVIANPSQVRRAVGVVGQKHGSDPNATGRENLVLQGEFYGITGRELKSKVAALLERFELADAADRQVRTYSGGMARRLDIAMGLLNRPKVLFLDEPTTGLDPEARALMWTYIAGLAAPAGHPAQAVIERIDGVGEIELDGRMLRARALDGAAALPTVLAALEGEGIKVASV